jgi:hypothetical protein
LVCYEWFNPEWNPLKKSIKWSNNLLIIWHFIYTGRSLKSPLCR